MRNYRRLPPFLRLASIAGLLLALASLALPMRMLPTRLSTSDWPADFPRVEAISSSLGMLGLSCAFVVAAYSMRFRRAGAAPFLLDSWQRQVRAFLLVAALPLCVLSWAVIIPTTQPGFGNVFLISMLAAGVLLAANIWMLVRHQAAQ